MYRRIALLALPLLLAACGKNPAPQLRQMEQAPVRAFDPAKLERGRGLFAQNCASCHGDHAQGAQNWFEQDARGKWPPPPLNGTGHAWHHPRAVLERTIREGTAALGGDMPAWDGKLSKEDIDAIIDWLQQQWPEELYAAWWRMDRQSVAGGQ